MIRSKKGTAAVIDAFIFITVIGLIAAGMFAYSNVQNDKEAKAKEIYESFFAIELKTNDLFDGADTQCVRMCDLIAAHMASGQGSVDEYIEGVLNSIIPPIYNYVFAFEYDGRSMVIGNEGQKLTSKYSSDMMTLSGKPLHAVLTLY